MLKIRDWGGTWETHETRKAIKLRWVSLPVDLSSSGYVELMMDPDGPEIYGIWIALVQVAAQAPERGVIARQGGKPYSLSVLAGTIRVNPPRLRAALPKLRAIGWIEATDNDFSELLSEVKLSSQVTSLPEQPGESPVKSGESTEESGYRTGPNRTGPDQTRPTGREEADSPSAPGPSLKSAYPSSAEDAQRKAEAIARLRGSVEPAKPEPSPEPVSSEVTDVSSELTPAPYEPPQPPDFGQIDTKPTPKDVLTAWDSAYHLSTGVPYPRTAAASEAKSASQIIKAIENTGGDWERIPRSIQAALNDPWAKDKGFKVYASQFAKFDAQGQGGGLSSIERFIMEAEEREEAERRAAQ